MTLPVSITGHMATHLAGGISALPDVVAKAKLCLTDFLSGAFEAAPLDWAQQAANIATPVADGAALIAGKALTTPGEAAFANAVAAHGLVREDMHTGSISHLGVVIWPALLAALAQADRPISGQAFLAAGIAGYEVGGRIGTALMTPQLARLFRPTGMSGPFASAAACALLKELNVSQIQSALGIAANTTGGFNEWPHSGGSEMYFHAGFAARNGLVAAQLAQLGAFAAPSILEGEAGLFEAVGRTDPPNEIVLFPDGDHVISSVFHKQAPACNYAQTPCQAAVHAARKYSGLLDDIKTITVRITDAARLYPGCDHVGPYLNVLQAKMSIQYGVATAIAAGGVFEANYARIGDAEIERLIGLTQLVVAADLTAAYPGKQGAGVEIATKDGGIFDATLGDIETAGANEIQTRFDRSAASWLGRETANALVDFVSEIESCDDVRALNRLCISYT